MPVAERWFRAVRVTVQRGDGARSAALSAALREARLGPLLRTCGDTLAVPARAGLSLRLTGDVELQALNARFLGHDVATDVLAFPSGEPGRVGDIAISVERAAAQANGDLAAELRLLAVHGLLHCLGHDHAGAGEAAAMTAATRRLLPDQAVPDLEPAR